MSVAVVGKPALPSLILCRLLTVRKAEVGRWWQMTEFDFYGGALTVSIKWRKRLRQKVRHLRVT